MSDRPVTAPTTGGDRLRSDGLHRPRPERLGPAHPRYAAILAAHDAAVAVGSPSYADPGSGLFVFTAVSHAERGRCCDGGCRHCPFE